eukprot:COSAG01_NODE_6548_length_3613_cov_5.195043_2_plen_169_part_00
MEEGYEFPDSLTGGHWWNDVGHYLSHHWEGVASTVGAAALVAGMFIPGVDVVEGAALAGETAESAEGVEAAKGAEAAEENSGMSDRAASRAKWKGRLKKYGGVTAVATGASQYQKDAAARPTNPNSGQAQRQHDALAAQEAQENTMGDVNAQYVSDRSAGTSVMNPYR